MFTNTEIGLPTVMYIGRNAPAVMLQIGIITPSLNGNRPVICLTIVLARFVAIFRKVF